MTQTLADVQAAIAAWDKMFATLANVGIWSHLLVDTRREAERLAIAYCRTGGWLPIADGLPDKPDGMGQDAFLAMHPEGRIYLATQHPDWWNHKDERGPEFDGEQVTHWQPLPAPPVAGGDDNGL